MALLPRFVLARVDYISCPIGQNLLGKCVPRTDFPSGHNWAPTRPVRSWLYFMTSHQCGRFERYGDSKEGHAAFFIHLDSYACVIFTLKE